MPTRYADGRWPTLDRAERAIRYPAAYRAAGPFREELLGRRAAAQLALQVADRDLAELMTRRARLVSRIEGCNLALVGTGEIRHPETGEVRQTMRWHKRIQFADELPAADGPTLRVVSGRALATAATDLLGATGQTLTIAEIERLLRLQGLLPEGRASSAISNALRGEVRAGRVARVHRGCYRLP